MGLYRSTVVFICINFDVIFRTYFKLGNMVTKEALVDLDTAPITSPSIQAGATQVNTARALFHTLDEKHQFPSIIIPDSTDL